MLTRPGPSRPRPRPGPSRPRPKPQLSRPRQRPRPQPSQPVPRPMVKTKDGKRPSLLKLILKILKIVYIWIRTADLLLTALFAYCLQLTTALQAGMLSPVPTPQLLSSLLYTVIKL